MPRTLRMIVELSFLAVLHAGLAEGQVAGVDDILALAQPEADVRIFYGDGPLQFGDLRVPDGNGPYPVAIVIHGGCWLSEYDIDHIGAAAEALRQSGIATWALEYRRVGDPGGGWPGIFLDLAQGADTLRRLAREHSLDLDRVIALGHSAGGHLALWLAARANLPSGSPITSDDPLLLRGVLGLAAAPDLEMVQRAASCDRVIEGLLGGSPDDVPGRYQLASPMYLLPLGGSRRSSSTVPTTRGGRPWGDPISRSHAGVGTRWS